MGTEPDFLIEDKIRCHEAVIEGLQRGYRYLTLPTQQHADYAAEWSKRRGIPYVVDSRLPCSLVIEEAVQASAGQRSETPVGCPDPPEPTKRLESPGKRFAVAFLRGLHYLLTMSVAENKPNRKTQERT